MEDRRASLQVGEALFEGFFAFRWGRDFGQGAQKAQQAFGDPKFRLASITFRQMGN
jgi:hypothetical protein